MVLVPNDLNATWRAMEELVISAKCKRIGLCNFTTQMIRQIISTARIRPTILQVELHPENAQEKLVRFAIENNLRVTGFSAMGASSYIELGMANDDEILLKNRVVNDIAVKYRKTPAQVMIRWAIQRKTFPLTKTINSARMKENRNVFDFYLKSEDMKAINNLNINKRYNDPGVFTLGMGTFCPIYE